MMMITPLSVDRLALLHLLVETMILLHLLLETMIKFDQIHSA